MPQIRFSARETASDAIVTRTTPAAGVSSNFYSASISPPSVSRPRYGQLEAEVPNTRRAGGMDRQAALRSALNAGAIAAVLSLLPLGFILALPLAGFLGVRLYRRRSSAQELSTSAGFKLGGLCGAFGFVIFTVLTAVNTLGFRAQDEFRGAMIEAVRRAQARNPDVQAHQMLEYFTSPQGLVVMMVLGGIFICVAFVLLSGLGGAISAALLRRKGPSA